MKIKDYNTERTIPEIITWSRNCGSLLASFGFFIENNKIFFYVYTNIDDYKKKRINNAYIVYKNDIVNFLKKKGAKLVLGKTNKIRRN
jgi:hypothetical protein